MPKPFGLIKSVLGNLFKPRDIYPPIRPNANTATTNDNKILLDSTFATVKSPEQKVKPKAKKKEPEPTINQVIPWEDRRKSDILFAARPSIMIGFPMTKPKEKPKGMHLLYQRRNGGFGIDIVSDPRFGVPYGQDQLFVLAIVDHALKNNSAKVDIISIYRILKELGICTGGSQYRAVQQMMLRVFGSVATCWFKEGNGISGQKFIYFSKIHLEILKDKYDYNPADGDYIILSQEFFDDFKNHPIPYDMEVLKRLKSSPGAMRLYLWAAPRAFRIPALQGSNFVTLEQIANDLGATTINNPRAFKQKLELWANKVSEILTQVNGHNFAFKIEKTGLRLYRQNMVPSGHKMKPTVDNKILAKAKSKKAHKEFDIDWVLEREIESFEVGLTKSISQQAVKYKQAKARFESA